MSELIGVSGNGSRTVQIIIEENLFIVYIIYTYFRSNNRVSDLYLLPDFIIFNKNVMVDVFLFAFSLFLFC